MLKGVAASAGIGIGNAVLVQQDTIKVEQRIVNDVETEKRRFLDAVERFVSELEDASAQMQQSAGPAEAAILDTQIAMVRDQELIGEVLRIIECQRVNVEYAVNLVCNGYIALLSDLENELIAARSADFQDLRDRLLRILLGIRQQNLSRLPVGSVLVAEDIPPSQAVDISRERIAGIVTHKGTKFSHVSIIARALQVPVVVAIDQLFDVLKGGELLIVDGDNGYVCIDPSSEVQQEYRERQRVVGQQSCVLLTNRERPAVTADGKTVQLEGNLSVVQELNGIQHACADGIGLLRTEFLFMAHASAPTEQEQYQFYAQVVKAMAGKPVTIRTLDSGGDKEVSYLHKQEDNPALGHRAIRYCLHHPEMFRRQIAAILRAAALGRVRMLLPMISSISELREAKVLIAQAVEELEKRGETFSADVPVGIMIETPAAVLCADDLACEADFFSIGTNDLTQYILAVDRGNGNLTSLYSPMHPAVLRAVAITVRAAYQQGIRVSVCGESGADPLLVPFYIGAGVDTLSVSSSALLPTRAGIGKISRAVWERRVPEILALQTIEEVRRYLLSRQEQDAEG